MKFIYIYLTICITSFMAGCKKFVQIDPPNTQLVTQSVFGTTGTATAAVTSIYTQMQTESFQMSQACGLLSDELNGGPGNSGSILEYYTNSMNAYDGSLGVWSRAFSYIYQANAIIEKLQGSKGLTQAISNQLLGEAKFIRAFWFFYLTNCYGDVPLVTTTDYTVNAVIQRSAVSKVYEQIISDLNDAKGLLNANFIDRSDTTATNDRVRPTSWAAMALLARAYLYIGDFPNAEKSASTIIDNSTSFSLVDSLDDVFKANSKEAIWQLGVPRPTNVNTIDGENFILVAPPSSGSTFLSDYLLDSFEVGDRRKVKWVGVVNTTDSPIVSYYFPYKYKVFQSPNVTEYTMMIRLAEVYLIRAEAKAQQNMDPDGAVADLNKIRHRAGLPEYVGPHDKESLLIAILHERKYELFCEWGHRWFDLIRTANIHTVMSEVTPSKGGAWSDNWRLFPIPQSEIIVDHNLTQNPGY